MKKTRVLLVDDEMAFTTICALWLEASGYFVTCEENCPLSVVATAKRFRPELIFLDLHLPGKTGLEIAAELQAEDDLASVPVVILTGSLTKQEAADKRMQGVPAVAKPLLACDLVQAAMELLNAQTRIGSVSVN